MDYTRTAEWNKQNDIRRLKEQKRQMRGETNSCYKCQYRMKNGGCEKGQNTSKPCYIDLET